MKKLDPRWMLIVSMTVFGTLGLFVRNIPVSSGELALYRAVLAALLIGVYLLISKQNIPFARIKREVPLLLLSGAAMGVNWILLFEAYRYTSVSVATLSYYFAPVIVTLVCPILFHEKLTGKKFLCFVMSTLGLVLITGIGDTRGSDDLKGILFGLGAAVFYATVILLNKSIHQVEGIHRTFLQFLSAIVVLIPYVLSTNGITLSSLNAIGWVNLLIVGLVHTGVTYCMYFSSLKELPGQEAAISSPTSGETTSRGASGVTSTVLSMAGMVSSTPVASSITVRSSFGSGGMRSSSLKSASGICTGSSCTGSSTRDETFSASLSAVFFGSSVQ